jgi:hypothetical protein
MYVNEVARNGVNTVMANWIEVRSNGRLLWTLQWTLVSVKCGKCVDQFCCMDSRNYSVRLLTSLVCVDWVTSLQEVHVVCYQAWVTDSLLGDVRLETDILYSTQVKCLHSSLPLVAMSSIVDRILLIPGGLVSLWLYKENKLRDWKNVFTPHIPAWAPHTYDFVVLTSLSHTRKILLILLLIGK